jgi:DNA-binding SARP family transcriptional activator
MRERLEEQKRAAGEKMVEVKRAGGVTDEAYERMRAILLDIDPAATKEQGGSRPHGSYLR